MLDMGFADDLETILGAVPAERQTALFSATVSPAIGAIARKHLTDPVHVRVRAARSAAGTTVTSIRQLAYVVRRTDKLAALCRVLDVEDPSSALVFGRTRGEVDDLAEQLERRGHDAAALHGGMSQDQRDRVMTRFREGTLDVLVATDVAARGLDIEHVSHVVNYDVPTDTDAYVHRIGRTGRAGREGVAITLLEPREHRLLRDIERVTGVKVELAHVPTVADLRERRLELLRASLREALLQEGLDRYRAVVEPLADEFDIVEIALAAVAMHAGATTVASDEVEIPTLPISGPPAPRDRRGNATGPGVPPFPGRPGSYGPGEGGGEPVQIPLADGWARLWVGGGRRIGMRPGDLVGAIANEAGLPASAIGRIMIGEGSSLVDVREDAADLVIGSLTGARIRGRALEIRRDAGPRPGGGSWQAARPMPRHPSGRPMPAGGGPARPAPSRPMPPRPSGPRPPGARPGDGPGPSRPAPR
jgi:ATP-dependent RNA helicase DeaD